MKDYELQICKDIQQDIIELGGNEWSLEDVYSFWAEWSDMLAAGWLGYEKGDLGSLMQAVELMNIKINEK